MPQYSLSLCMPTYNFGKFIGETLESILPQMTPEIELVIVDGASTDETPHIVGEYAKKCPQLRYERLAKRGGIDRDMVHSVTLAQGEYVWLFSSDDIMRPNAIQQILNEIKSSLDLYLCGFTICGFDIRKIYWEHPILGVKKKTDFNLSDPKERVQFFQSAITTTAFFSFMSSLVVRRERWNQENVAEEFYGSCWAHVARIFSMIQRGLKIRYLPGSFLWKRGSNDSFADQGMVRRVSIAFDGYHHLANTFFGEASFEAFHIRRVVLYEFPLITILVSARSQVRSPEENRRLNQIVLKLYKDPTWINYMRKWIYFRIPSFSIDILAWIYKRRSFFRNFRVLRIKRILHKILPAHSNE